MIIRLLCDRRNYLRPGEWDFAFKERWSLGGMDIVGMMLIKWRKDFRGRPGESDHQHYPVFGLPVPV